MVPLHLCRASWESVSWAVGVMRWKMFQSALGTAALLHAVNGVQGVLHLYAGDLGWPILAWKPECVLTCNRGCNLSFELETWDSNFRTEEQQVQGHYHLAMPLLLHFGCGAT